MKALGGLLFLSFCSCAWFRPSLSTPPATVQKLSIQFDKEDEARFDVTLMVANRDRRTLSVTSFAAEFWVNERWFASATALAPQKTEIPAGHSAPVTFSLPLTFRREGRRDDTSVVMLRMRGQLGVSTSSGEDRWKVLYAQNMGIENAPVFSRESEEVR